MKKLLDPEDPWVRKNGVVGKRKVKAEEFARERLAKEMLELSANDDEG